MRRIGLILNGLGIRKSRMCEEVVCVLFIGCYK